MAFVDTPDLSTRSSVHGTTDLNGRFLVAEGLVLTAIAVPH
jgi:hypothetical protein